MNVRRVHVLTDAAGDFVADVRTPGEILGVALVLGTLSTPDLDVDDTLTGTSILSVTAEAATIAWRPLALEQGADGVDIAAAAGPPLINNVYAPVVCYGSVTVTVAGAGDKLEGDVYIAFRG